MATTTKAAAPAKKNSGFGGVKDAWIILVICAIAGYSVWYFVMGNPDNFIGGDRSGHPAQSPIPNPQSPIPNLFNYK